MDVKRSFEITSALFAGTALGFVCGLVVYEVLTTEFEFKNLAAWFGGLATSIAAAVALWFGLAEERRQRISRNQKTRLCLQEIKGDMKANCARIIEMLFFLSQFYSIWVGSKRLSFCALNGVYERIKLSTDNLSFNSFDSVRDSFPDIDEDVANAIIEFKDRVQSMCVVINNLSVITQGVSDLDYLDGLCKLPIDKIIELVGLFKYVGDDVDVNGLNNGVINLRQIILSARASN